MEKPLTTDRKKRLATNKSHRIIAENRTENQQRQFIKLSNYVVRDEIDHALNLLEQSGVIDNVASFVVANLQDLMRGAQ